MLEMMQTYGHAIEAQSLPVHFNIKIPCIKELLSPAAHVTVKSKRLRIDRSSLINALE
jgi:hypothetical protein